MLSHAETLGRYLGVFVDELAAAGLSDVCLCPGSRSTPLALTFARHPRIKVWTHLDERSCAYFALGMAKSTSRAVAVLCSSGTAAVNFAPAVVEAFHSRVPLLALTADRPPELQELGANQTIDQVRLYGSAAKWSAQLPLPDASEQLLRHARMTAARALATAEAAPAGPVHLNFPLREPLIPAPPEAPASSTANVLTRAMTPAPEAPRLDGVVEAITAARRGLVVCGPGTRAGATDVAGMAGALGFPLLADPLSNLRCGPHVEGADIIATYDSFLRPASIAGALAPDLVLRFGAPPTSKPLATYLQRHREARQIVIATPDTWPDPDLSADDIVYCDEEAFCREVLRRRGAGHAGEAWSAAWRQVDSLAEAAVCDELKEHACMSEPGAVLDLAATLPDGYTLFAGNSMPVRDVDSFWPASPRPLYFLGNRGASGIDGVVSTALGAAAKLDGRLALLIGDLSFYHDMNGLLAAQRFGLKATIVLLNNDGGGIFSFLPQHDEPEHFEALFGTPHGLDFSHVAALYGVNFRRVTSREEYRQALLESFVSDGVDVIEVRTDREENLGLHQRLWEAAARAVQAPASGTA